MSRTFTTGCSDRDFHAPSEQSSSHHRLVDLRLEAHEETLFAQCIPLYSRRDRLCTQPANDGKKQQRDQQSLEKG